jgi:hypothetical protein
MLSSIIGKLPQMTPHQWDMSKFTVIITHCDHSNTLLKAITRKSALLGAGEVSAELSLGDIAHFAGADIALRCGQSLDWKDINLRRAIVGIVVRWIQRAYPRMNDIDVIEDVTALESWSKGEAIFDLASRHDRLLKGIIGMSPEPPHTSDEVAIMQIWMLMQVTLGDAIGMNPWINYGAASVAILGSQLISDARDDPEEMARQIQDIIERFPRT